MKPFSDPAYLAGDQYRNASNLNARVALHERFSTNPQGWSAWLSERLVIAEGGRVLELGCGPAHLWAKNVARLPAGCRLTLTDLSPGMVAEAQRNMAQALGQSGPRPDLDVRFQVMDAQEIPFDDASCDVVIANHMLYHVPDRERALTQIRRVLRPGGRFYASTIGRAHLIELVQLAARFGITTGLASSSAMAEAFGLETGGRQLVQRFADVRLHLYDDGLVVTEAEPLIAYVMSSMSVDEIAACREPLAALTRSVTEAIARQGEMRVTKASGLFQAIKPHHTA
jgi:SAM-dependent methyltransferase